MNLTDRILFNTITGWINRAINIMSALIITPILLLSLGKYEYGLWVTLGQGAAFLWFLDFGVANSVCRYISRSDSQNNFAEEQGIFSTAMVIFFSAAILVAISTIAISNFIPVIFNVEPSLNIISKILFLSLGLNIGITFPLRVGRGLLQSKHRYDFIDFISMIATIMQLALIIIFSIFNYLTLYVICFVTIAGTVIIEILLFAKALHVYPNLRFNRRTITKKRVRDIFSLGTSSVLLTISGMLSNRGQTVSAGMILGFNTVPFFSIPCNMINKIGPFIGRTGTTFMPIANGMEAVGDNKRLQELSIYGHRYGLILGLFIGLYLVLFGKEILQLWLQKSELSSNDVHLMFISMVIMVFPMVFSRANKANLTILRATGHHWIVSNSLFIFSFIGLIVGIVLMKYTSLGILGAAVGYSIRGVFAEIVLATLFTIKKLDIPKVKYLNASYGYPIVASIPIFIINFFAIKFLSLSDLNKIIFGSSIYIVTSLFFFYTICIEIEHRHKLANFLKKQYSQLTEHFKV